jgi:hypothetical protein
VVLVTIIAIAFMACAERRPAARIQGPALTVTIQLPTGEKQTLAPAAMRPTARAAFPGAELPYSGNAAATALSLTKAERHGVAFVLYEGPGPWPSVMLDAIEIGYPTDGPVARFDLGESSSPASLPCVSRTAFFIDGVGGTPPDTVLIWYRDGPRETSFKVQSRGHMLKLRPILRFHTRDLPLLAHKTTEYSIAAETSTGAKDLLVIAVARKPDRSFIASVFPASQGRHEQGNHVDHLEWRFYALDDPPHLRSRCRGRSQVGLMRPLRIVLDK